MQVAYMHEEKRNVGNNSEHPSLKVVQQMMEHVQREGGSCVSLETEFTTDGAKAFALMLERNSA